MKSQMSKASTQVLFTHLVPEGQKAHGSVCKVVKKLTQVPFLHI
jgi:hypothetical protein